MDRLCVDLLGSLVVDLLDRLVVVPDRLEGAPLRGWNSWQAFASDVDQTVREDVTQGAGEDAGAAGRVP